MSDQLTPDERRLRSLTRKELERKLAAQDALIERDRAVMAHLAEHGSPARTAEVMNMHWTRVYQIRNGWPGREARWEAARPKLVAKIAAIAPTPRTRTK